MCWPGGVLQISVDGDDRTEAKIKTPKNPIFGGFQTKPQKRPRPKIELTSKKSHAEFSSFKAVTFGCTLFGRTTRLGYTKNLQSVLNTPKNQATQKNTCQSFQPPKNPESKSSNPKNSLHHPRQLKSGVPHPPPPPPRFAGHYVIPCYTPVQTWRLSLVVVCWYVLQESLL